MCVQNIKESDLEVFSHSTRIFYSYKDVTTDVEGMQNLGKYTALMALSLSLERTLSFHPCSDTGQSHLEDCLNVSPLTMNIF